MEAALRVEHVSKAFPGVQALDDVSLDIRKGEIHAVVGENGAGKSTLMKILSGIYTKDSGTIYLEGTPVTVDSPRRAQDLGVSMIHQELNLPLNIGIHQNIFMGRLPASRFGFVNWKKLAEDCQQLLDMVQLHVNPSTRVGTLPVAKQQLVEIAKALSFQSTVLIMDEPTSALTLQETAILFDIMRSLKERGVAIIYISHRLEEVFRIADTITVMRDGKVVGNRRTGETTHEEIVRMMTGKTFSDFFAHGRAGEREERGEPILEVKGISQKRILRGVSFTLHKGEVLGIAGLMGAGRTELVRALFGADRILAGEVFMEGRAMRPRSPKEAIGHGLALLPEDRKLHGLLLGMSVCDNISLVTLRHLARLGFIQRSLQLGLVKEHIGMLNIKTPGPFQLVRNLSGGNQQKVVMAKWLAARPKVLLLDDPTRGVDVGAKAEIYAIIRELARKGMGIIFISSELPEVLGVSDRILVMRSGEIVSELSPAEATEERVMLLATGHGQGRRAG